MLNIYSKLFIPIVSTNCPGFFKDNLLLIPGGWSGSQNRSGHAMIYRLEIKKGTLYFILYNTGAGLENHNKRLQSDPSSKEAYFQSNAKFAFKFKIDQQNFNEDLLVAILKKIMSPIILEEKTYEALLPLKFILRLYQ